MASSGTYPSSIGWDWFTSIRYHGLVSLSCASVCSFTTSYSFWSDSYLSVSFCIVSSAFRHSTCRPSATPPRNPATRIDTQDTANTLPGCCIFRIRYLTSSSSLHHFSFVCFFILLSFLLTYATSSSVIRSSTAAYHQFPGLPNIQRQKILSLSVGIRGNKIPP